MAIAVIMNAIDGIRLSLKGPGNNVPVTPSSTACGTSVIRQSTAHIIITAPTVVSNATRER